VAQFDEDRAAVMARAAEAGVTTIVNPGIDLTHCRQAVTLAERDAGVYAAVGIHPNSSDQVDTATLTAVRQLADHPKVVAIGEIGLDYYWDKVPAEQQAKVFRAQLEIAAEVGLPVIIHNREATTETLTILQDWAQSPVTRNSALGQRPFWGVLHAFGGDLTVAQQAYDLNFVLGIGGPVTFRNARQLHEVVAHLDLDRLMVETDAPYLTPHPYRGRRNEPAYVAFVCAQLAALHDLPPTEIARRTSAVAATFFGFSQPV
jgi:TatD DNase family protein